MILGHLTGEHCKSLYTYVPLVTYYLAAVSTCVSYAEAHLSYRLDVCPSVRHTLVLYQNG